MASNKEKSNFDLEKCEKQVGSLLESMVNNYKGSKGEFDESIRKMARLYKTVRKMVPKKVLTTGGMMVLNHYMKGSTDALNRYLDMDLDKGKGAKGRQNIAEYAVEKLDELADKLDKSKEDLERNDKPAINEIKEEISSIKSEMILKDDIKKDMKNDGKKYPDAMKEYSKLESQWAEASNKKQTREEKEYSDYATMEKMKKQLQKTQSAINNYLRSTEGKAQDKVTRKRVETMLEGKASVERQLRKIEDMENEKSKDPIKDYKELYQGMQSTKEKLGNLPAGRNDADINKAREAFELVTDMTKRMAEKGPDYVPTAEELDELNDAQARAEHQIDSCLQKIDDAGINSDFAKQQTGALEEAKNVLYDTKRTIKTYKDNLIEKDYKLPDEEIENRDREVISDLKKNGKSRNDTDKKDYDDFVDKYEKSAESSKNLTTKEKPSREDYNSVLKDLSDTKSSADKYLSQRAERAEKGSPEIRRKLESVKKADDVTTVKINKFTKERDDIMSKSKEDLKDAMDLRNNALKAEQKNAKVGNRTRARATAEANKALTDFSQKTRLTPQEKQGARRAIAAMILEAKLKGPEGEMLRKQIPANKYGKAIEQLANSKEFKEILPDKAITPTYCAKIAAGKTDVSKLSNRLSNSLKEVAKSQKIKQKHFDQIRKKELNLEAPKPKNPGFAP